MPGLRERKKQQTRDAIVREAMRLFAKRGFDETTIADIAEAADISPRTFFSYFESKEAVVFHDFDDLVATLRAHLESREPGATTFDAIRSWCAQSLERRDMTSRQEVARHRLIRRTPALAAHEDANRAVFERLVAQNVASDLDLDADALQTRMVSAAAVAALSSLGEMDPEELPEDPMSVVDEAISFLQGGLGALRSGS